MLENEKYRGSFAAIAPTISWAIPYLTSPAPISQTNPGTSGGLPAPEREPASYEGQDNTMKRWAEFLFKRLVCMILTLFLITSATFFLMNLLPGTPYNNQDRLTEIQLQMLNEKYGLNQPLLTRYGNYSFRISSAFKYHLWRR